MGDGGYLRKNSGAFGEIVEVEGGHIVRATGRKDRHSKVCTAKGPRDRRVRLAAHTAIQFYDVQDRLGYDRPSKAVDWLIKKAKTAIDELAELPAWHPTGLPPENAHGHHRRTDLMASGSPSRRATAVFDGGGENDQISSFLPPSLDSDVISDTIKSFFPMCAAAGGVAGEPSSNNNQDLRLSLQSFQDSNFIHHHNPPPPPQQTNPNYNHHHQHHHSDQQSRAHAQQILLSGTPLGFDSWTSPTPDHQSWNSGGDAAAGFMFNPSAAAHQNQFFTNSQRGPLQSSNTPSQIRAWMDPPTAIAISMAADQHHHHLGAFPSSFSGGFASGYGGFSAGFPIPARIQGDEEEHDGYSDKPSSASSDSRH